MNRHTLTVPTLLVACMTLAACGGGAAPAPATTGPGGAAEPATAPAQTTPAPATPAAGEPATPAPAAVGPIDACALLAADEVATLVADATPTANADETGPIPTYSCTWDAAISDGMIPASLGVTVSPGFVSGSGTTAEFITAMLQAEGSDPENGGRVVADLGDIGVVTSVVTFDAEAKFLAGDTLATVTLTRDDAPSQQDGVVELARAIAGRLP